MKLWVDDERPAPEGWVWAKTVSEARWALMCGRAGWHQKVSEVSLDHDLGGDSTTREVVLWMCENDYWPEIIRVHTANPVGRDWLVGMINKYGPGVQTS